MPLRSWQWNGPWNSLVHGVANQKGTWQCHGMAMGLSKEGPNGRGWPMALPFRKHQAKPWHGHVCVWGVDHASPIKDLGPWDGQSESTRQSHGMAIGGANTRPMEELGPCDGQSESTKECHGMGIRAMSISMEELGPWDGQPESPDQCHGMAMGGCQ